MNNENDVLLEKIDALIQLQQNLLALELARNGVRMDEIAKRLHVAKAKVVTMLRGVRRSE